MVTADKMNPFVLPERSPPDNLEDEYDHKEFKQWISDLPIGNLSKVARLLHHEINRHNRLEMSPVERFEAIQLMLPALSFVREGLWSRYSTKPIPFSREDNLIARLHLDLLVSVVVTYKTVMSQFHDDSFTGHLLHKRTRSESVRYTLYFLSEILLHQYSIYRISPKFVWREIHGIYHYAVINDLQHNETEEADDTFVEHMSIVDIYKRILLLALADPNGLLRGEIKRISEALIDWLPEVSLVPVTHDISLSSVFVVDATKDAPPYVTDAATRKQVKVGWLLLTDKLDEILQRKADEIRDKSVSKLRPVELVTANLYEKLRKKWTAETVLREERAKGSGAVEIVGGLEPLHWLFGGWKLQQEVATDLGAAVASESEAEGKKTDENPVRILEQDEFVIDADPDLIAAIVSGPEAKEDQIEMDPVVPEEIEVDFSDTVVDADARGEECDCVNESKRGYYLTWSGRGEYRVHVGDLVGVNSKESHDFDRSWGLGVIRWMRVQANGLMGFGIERFEGEIESIRLDCRRGMGSGVEAILGFQQTLAGKIESVITRPFFFNAGDRLSLTTSGDQYPVVPGQIIECTDVYMRFKIRSDSNAEDAGKKSSSRHSEAGDIFNSIWDDL